MHDLEFNKETHTYKVGEDLLISVTDLISYFFPFDEKKALESTAIKTGFKVDYIKALWERQKKQASDFGTRIHKCAENIYENGAFIQIKKENKGLERQIIKFFNDHKHLKKFMKEAQVFSFEKKLAGTIDLVMQDKFGDCYIFDWKTNREIKKEGFGNAKAPISHLNDSPYTRYGLQLNAYKWLLTNVYGQKVVYLGLVHLNAANDSYCVLEVPDMQDEIEKILEYYSSHSNALLRSRHPKE
jgi:ATP-dependent exoDNAse (exonuclease V) beta subunit